MNKRTVEISLEIFKEWFNSNDKSLREITESEQFERLIKI